MASTILKGTFCLVNILYALIAVALAGGALWYSIKVQEVTDLRSPESYQLDLNFTWPQIMPYVFVAIGVFVLIVTCCGFCGAGANSKGTLITYNVFAFIVILIFVGAAVVSTIIAPEKSEKFIIKTLHNVFEQTKVKRDIAERFGHIESNLRCCGADGPMNYLNSGKSLPKSCCDANVDCFNYLTQRKGCIEVITQYNRWAFLAGTIASGTVAFLCLISMVLSIALKRTIRSKVIT